VFLLDLIPRGPDIKRRESLADRFPMRKVRPFLCLAGRLYLPGIPQFKKPKKLPDFFNSRFLQKRRTIPHEKCHFLLGMNFLDEEITKLTSNFTERKVCFLYTE
jgi:hypothetical protein